MPGLQNFLYALVCWLAPTIPSHSASVIGSHEVLASGEVELIILGTLQDGGSLHMGCMRSCCAPLYDAHDPDRKVVSLGPLDKNESKAYLFEVMPDISSQMALLRQWASFTLGAVPDGKFITHAHIGHYAGLMFLGRESLNAIGVPVFTMPLRDEYSETVGFEIIGPEKRALFIPDIDKWERWEKALSEKLQEVDYAFLDATFYSTAEVGCRDIDQIPHPLVTETMGLLSSLPEELRNRVHFIHMNHTNPLLDPESDAHMNVVNNGFKIAGIGDRFEL